jgi:hypothetical protein
MLIIFQRINRNFNMILHFTLMRDEFDNVQVEKPSLENQNHSCKYMRRRFLFFGCPVDCYFSCYLQHNNILSMINFGLRKGNFQQMNKRANQKDIR